MKSRSCASTPCLANEIDPTYFDPLAVDWQQALDVARWRKAERARLLAERAALPGSARHAAAEAIADHLDQYLDGRFGSISGMTVSAWWPINAELNLRRWLQRLAAQGARAALPVVVKHAAPLAFRPWTAKTRMERDFWNIPVPVEAPEVMPDIMLSPLVGWDPAGAALVMVEVTSTARSQLSRHGPSPSVSDWMQRKFPPYFRNHTILP